MNNTSTTTLVELVNLVLLGAGEEPCRTVNETVASKRAAQAVRDGLYSIGMLGAWTHERALVAPSTWNNTTQTCVVTGITKVNGVWFDGNRLPYQEYSLVVGNVSTEANERPCAWTQLNNTTFRLSPHPLPDAQPLVFFEVELSPLAPRLDTDVTGVPEFLITPLVSRATGVFCLRHLADPTLANQYNNEFEVFLQAARSMDSHTPRNEATMHPRRR
jgi:hypothetical protein